MQQSWKNCRSALVYFICSFLVALFRLGQGNQKIEHHIKCEDEQEYAY
jgi:hypothetical protein